MFTRTTSHRPPTSLQSAAAAPSFAVQRFIQPKLTVGPVDDPFEREAGRVAGRLPAGSLLSAPVFATTVQRQEAEEDQDRDQEDEEGDLDRLKAAAAPPLQRYSVLGRRILQQELARQSGPRIGSAGPSPIPTKLATGLAGPRGLREPSAEVMRSAAAEGVRTPAVTLPFLDRIQTSFGRHPVGHIKAHVGPKAGKASQAMNALAFASGDHVVFGRTPDLHTAAHEAAHIVQQRAGVQLAGGIGREGDAYERHANAVADAVVTGRSAEGFLEPFAALLPSSPVFPHSMSTEAQRQVGPGDQRSGQNRITIQRYALQYGNPPLWDGSESGTGIKTGLIKPNDPDIGKGKKVSKWPTWWPQGPAETAADFLRANFVQGHLLNEKLGGKGDTRNNLTPLTRSANSLMSARIETPAKDYLKQGDAIEYKVEADYSTHPTVDDVGAGHLKVNGPLLDPDKEARDLKIALDLMAGKVKAEIIVYNYDGISNSWVQAGMQPDLDDIPNKGPG